MTELAPDTEVQIEVNTEQQISRRIRRELEARIGYYARRTNEIDNRLRELDGEWDIERVLEANAGVELRNHAALICRVFRPCAGAKVLWRRRLSYLSRCGFIVASRSGLSESH